ncbi:Six-hairpin glycosidase [Jaminaea rosea]|uniref:cellulase n=1 Tax=Jaminaea rosea TaxID=1569628 RepID=A0A316UVU6_9BASI|nr:Six-hairpin glycosidase [Jaminaea rosea]PWN28918.1 Six-hairpin glycosidase [Jaminaea rosea]
MGHPTRILAALCLLFGAQSALAQVSSPSSAWQPAPSASGTVVPSSSSGPNSQWLEVLGSNLYYYDEQRAGVLPDDFRVDWRNTSVLTDGAVANVNLSAGFFDAGNFIKALFPLTYTLSSIIESALLWGEAYSSSSQAYYLDETLRNGLDWLMEASSQTDTLYMFVGDQTAYWGGDLNIPQPRPVYSVTRENPGTDVFASTATTLALGALLYSGKALPLSQSVNGTLPSSLRNTTYADSLSNRAVQLLELAFAATPMQVYQKAVDDIAWAYPSTDYDDELILGAAYTAMATGNISWVTTAIDTYSTNAYPPTFGALNWDSKRPMVPTTMAQLALFLPGADSRLSFTKFQNDSEVWLDALVAGNMKDTHTTPGGLFWFKGNSASASLNPALNAAVLCLKYAPMASTSAKTDAYRQWAQKQIDYALGKNPMNTVYQVGLHPNSAFNPHSALASGGTDLARINTSPPQELHVLYGAVVGGPDEDDKYYDVRDDYDQSEPALDTVAPMVAISSYFVGQGQSASNPFFVGLTAPRIIPKRPSSGLSGGAIAGIVIGVLLGVALLAVLGWFCWRKRGRNAYRRRKMGL